MFGKDVRLLWDVCLTSFISLIFPGNLFGDERELMDEIQTTNDD